LTIPYTPDIFAAQSYGGISRYLVEIIKRLPRYETRIQIFAGIHINGYLENLPGVIGIKVPNLWSGHKAGSLFLRMRADINAFLMRTFVSIKNDTIVHYSNYSKPLKRTAGRSIITVHDMIYELFPQFFPARDMTARLKKISCEFADKIVVVSNTTKDDLVRLLGVNEEKITVIYHGNSLKSVLPMETSVSDRGPFILYVGQRGGYKNFSAFIQAYSQSSLLRDNFRIICFGGGKFSKSEIEYFHDTGMNGNIFHVNGNDSMLARYYIDARCYVCPSLYEGFGMPILEAMGFGCPVICSNKGSIPEVAGGAALYFDPYDIDHIKSVLEAAVFDDTILSQLKMRGRERESQFSWERSASETFELYKTLLS